MLSLSLWVRIDSLRVIIRWARCERKWCFHDYFNELRNDGPGKLASRCRGT